VFERFRDRRRNRRRTAVTLQRTDGPAFQLLTNRARRALVLAQEEALELNHSFIGTEHVLLGLIREGEGLAAQVLVGLGISLQAVREKVEETIGPSGSAPRGLPPFTPRAKKVLELSLGEARQLGHNFIGTEHLLLGLVREGEGVAAQVLVGLGVDLSRVRQQVIQRMSGHQGREPDDRLLIDLPAQSEAESLLAPIGDSWIAQVVRCGTTPAVFAEAYEALAKLTTGVGIALEDLRVTVTSVETGDGPGLMLVVSYETLEPSHESLGDEEGDAGDKNLPG
jgi:hypothetical protein